MISNRFPIFQDQRPNRRRKQIAPFIALMGGIALVLNLAAIAIADDPSSGTLYWHEGDTLYGELLSVDEETLTWRSPLFVDPLQIERSALSAVQFRKVDPLPQSHDKFRISLRNGDVLFGDLIGATETSLLFESDRFSPFSVLLEHVEHVKRVDTPDLIYQGPRGVEGWTTPNPNTEPFGWNEQPNGELVTDSGNHGAYQKLDFSDRVEVEFVIESESKRPSFTFALGESREMSLRVESWEEILVLLSGFQFTELATLKEDQKRVHLHMFVDQKKHTVEVFSHSGVKLGELKGDPKKEEPEYKPKGLQIWNRDGDLTLKYIRVDRWNGNLPKPLKTGTSRIHLTDGSILYGDVPQFEPGEPVNFPGESDQEPTEFSVDQIESIVVNDDPESSPLRAVDQVSWQTGGVVTGKVLRVEDEQIEISAEWSEAPVSASLTGLQRIRLISEPTIPDAPDGLVYPGGTLNGKLVISNDTTPPVSWISAGGLNPSALNPNAFATAGNARFIRGEEPADSSALDDGYPDFLYLRNGDVIPCILHSVRDERIELEVPFSDLSEISTDIVKAVELSVPERVFQRGFEDEGWKRMLGGTKNDGDRLIMKTSATYGHPEILTGDEVRFRLDWGAQQYSELQIQLYGERLGNPRDATNLKIMLNGTKLWVEDFDPAVQAGNQLQIRQLRMNPAGGGRQTFIDSEKGSVEISLSVRDGKIHVVVDGQLLKSIPMDHQKRIGKSLTFKANVNSITRNAAYGSNPLTRGIMISDFEVRNLDGTSVKQFIVEETRNRTLLIPRFRRERPSSHVLMARNGDLLRGHLKHIDEETVQFESQLEEFPFSRERIAAVIWLHPPSTTETDETEEGQEAESDEPLREGMQLTFEDHLRFSMSPTGVQGDYLIGVTPHFGECRIPFQAIGEVVLGEIPQENGPVAYSQWIPTFAKEPDWDIPESGSNVEGSKLIGTESVPFELAGIDGNTFRIRDHLDKVVVLDFWATWCGPCVEALPDYIAATAEFDPEDVLFVAVNLQETPQEVRAFLALKGWTPEVAMDSAGSVASDFAVSGIPHTVILSPGNIIESVHVGYRENGGIEMRTTIQQILDGTWERPTPNTDEESESSSEE
ncbi:Thiol-disulfide oxidoreductase ResA [Thalassoglobus neptunius]|uniref:Thiol-disulfide oxidoreductase ResA n=1 Tax=Thalassoglobus neptunius TaxID=1938619 RepID=A0A5C5X768_9PLAN|nr:TlpA disulfide reductase family protein [Thalassoglobus neptunius]TWT57872.1 Thiol-disulfide oxidoreductase ResA [Thalassoglobus neptunius]